MDLSLFKIPFAYSFDQNTKWLHSGGKVAVAPPGGLGKLLFEKIKTHAENGLICQIESETMKEETYEEFFKKCVKIALYLRDQGVKAGDIISMCSQNNMNNIPVLIAAFFNGAILASTDPLLSSKDSKYLLDLVEPKLMFVCEASLDTSIKATEAKGVKIITLYEHDSFDNVPAILKKYTDDDVRVFVPYHALSNKEVISIQFSSGTTGLPKGTCLNHDGLYSVVTAPFPSGLRGVIFTTLYWSTGVCFAIVMLLNGCTRVNVPQPTPETTWGYLQRTKCNMASFSYGFCMQCIPYLKDNLPLPNLYFIHYTGGNLSVRFHKQLKETLPKTLLVNGYGMTETGTITVNMGQAPPESAGQTPPNDIIVKIVDIDTEQAVDLNVVGEIRVKGSNQLNGYYKRDSADIWDSEGFFKTGDVGYFNDKYELFIVDRIKEMFKYRGYHVIPEKIENILTAHPAVKQAIVIPVSHETDDSHAKGLIVLKDGCSVDVNEIVKFTNERIEDSRDHLRAGVHVIIESDIPYTATSKINRRQLKLRFGS